jgi:hypothetical protein
MRPPYRILNRNHFHRLAAEHLQTHLGFKDLYFPPHSTCHAASLSSRSAVAWISSSVIRLDLIATMKRLPAREIALAEQRARR